MIYLIVFSVSLCLLKSTDFIKSKIILSLILLISILIPSLLAGMRALTVGTDIMFYGYTAYNLSVTGNLSILLEHFSLLGDHSVLFYTIWYLLSKLFGNIFGPQFVLEMLIETCVLLTLMKLKGNNSRYHIWYGMAVYYFVFYSYSLNLMKQSLAIALVLPLIVFFLMKEKYVKFIVGVLFVAFFVHTSALICLLLPILKSVYSKGILKSSLLKVLSLFIPVFVMFIFRPVMGLIIKIVPRYSIYLTNSYSVTGGNRGAVIQSAMLLIIFIVFLVMSLTVRNTDTKLDFYEIVFLFGLGLFNFALVARNGYRIGLYMLFISIIILPEIFKNEDQVRNLTEYFGVSIIRSGLVLSSLILFWYVSFVLMGIGQVYPYTIGYYG